MKEFLPFLQTEIFGSPLYDWGSALLVFLLILTVLPVAKKYIGALRKRTDIARHHAALELAARLAARTTRLFLWAAALWVALLLVTLPPRAERVADRLMLVLFWLQAGIWIVAAVGYSLEKRRDALAAKGLAGSLNIAEFVARLLIWALVLLLLLENLGVNVTALVTGLGIGGVAVALAVQTVLGDLLASITIALDKPFTLGDFLVTGDDLMGAVEKIGIKSTRLRSLSGEQIIISNADLLKLRIHNYGRMHERRVLFSIAVSYDTPREKLTQLPGLFKALVQEHDKTRFDRAHFKEYGGTSLNFEIVYYVLAADFNLYMDIQQAINFRIHEEFERLGVKFVYPSSVQKLYLQKGDDQELAKAAKTVT